MLVYCVGLDWTVYVIETQMQPSDFVRTTLSYSVTHKRVTTHSLKTPALHNNTLQY